MAKQIKAVAWASAVTTAGADWLSQDVTVGTYGPTRHTFQMSMASANTVDMTMTKDDVVTVFPMNGGAVVSAAPHQESMIMVPGTTYNFDHAGGNHKVFLQVFEDEDDITV